jgi:hypothetical protein
MALMIPDGDCPRNRPPGLMFIKILGQKVGLSGVEDLFSRWSLAEEKSEGQSKC